MPDLILNEKHEYSLDGKKIDGLTSTIKEAGLIRNPDPWYMERGTAIHLATELWDKDILDESTVDPQIQGYLESWKRFRKDQGYTPSHIEYQIYHPELMVGMKIDRLPGPIDLKSGQIEPWHILQLAVQYKTCQANNIYDYEKDKPMNVYLDPDGNSPKIKIYNHSQLTDAFKIYASMLHFIRWKRSVGIKIIC